MDTFQPDVDVSSELNLPISVYLKTFFSGLSVLFVLLDIFAAFDTVVHHILIPRLEQWVCIMGSAINWSCSYFDDRSLTVLLDDSSSPSVPLFSHSFFPFIYFH